MKLHAAALMKSTIFRNYELMILANLDFVVSLFQLTSFNSSVKILPINSKYYQIYTQKLVRFIF